MGIEERPPLNIITLKEVLERCLEMRRGRELNVCIPNNKGGMGGTSATNVVFAGGGIDWDAGKFFIYPQVKMIEMPPEFTESKFQDAIQRIKTLEGLVQRLLDSIDTPRELDHAKRYAITVLEIFKKKPIK